MADYYPLITKAVAGLVSDASGESRQDIYEQARAALLGQLRTINPPFTEAEITRERLALEEAIRRAEGDAVKRARDTRVPILSDLATDADDLGVANPSSLDEISVEVPSMNIAWAASGRLTGVWRCTWQ